MKAPGARRKKLLLAVLLVSLAGFGGCVALVFQDEPPPDDSDLLLVRREVPAEQNGFLALDFTPDDVYWPDDDERLSVESADFDIDAARAVVEKNAAVLAKLDERLRHLALGAGEVDDLGPYQQAWNPVAVVASCRALLLSETGRVDEGLAAAIQVMALGKSALGSARTSFEYMLAGGILSLARGAAVRCLRYEGLQADVVRESLKRLSGLRPSPTDLQASLRGEYAYFLSLARQLEAGESVLPHVARAWLFRPFYYPYRTRRLGAEETRKLLRKAMKRSEARDPWTPEGPPAFWTWPVRCFNATGRSLLDCSLPSARRSLLAHDFFAAETAALEALLALRCHHLETGTLPASLHELVPRYLPAVPLDPYDGQPLRYSREQRIVYSVGQDLQDWGGAADTGSEQASENWDEPTFEIEF